MKNNPDDVIDELDHETRDASGVLLLFKTNFVVLIN